MAFEVFINPKLLPAVKADVKARRRSEFLQTIKLLRADRIRAGKP